MKADEMVFFKLIMAILKSKAFSLLSSSVMIIRSILVVCTLLQYVYCTVYWTVYTQAHSVHKNNVGNVPSKPLGEVAWGH